MNFFVGIVIALIISCTVCALIGSRIGAKFEEKALGAGSVEASIRGGFLNSATLGGMLGIIPFLIFLGVLIGTVMTSPRTHHGGGESAPAAAGH